MKAQDIVQALQQALNTDGGSVSEGVPMSSLTTFEIGGPAAVVVEPHSIEGIRSVVRLCSENDVRLRIVGLGSDLLIADEGLDCVVLRLAEHFASVSVDGNTIKAQAGASNKNVAERACEAGLAGYEFASGIPGTIGGAAIMNAGAYDGEFKDVCVGLECVTPDGELVSLSAAEADWGYRHSMMDEAGYVVVSATLSLHEDDSLAIRARMDDLSARRASKQPLEMPSAGSTFKRPEGYFAGKLIQDAGLRGYSIGGAQVSEKHTGFVVNAGNATAHDVLALIKHIQQKVLEHDGVNIQPEVRYWSNDN